MAAPHVPIDVHQPPLKLEPLVSYRFAKMKVGQISKFLKVLQSKNLQELILSVYVFYMMSEPDVNLIKPV